MISVESKHSVSLKPFLKIFLLYFKKIKIVVNVTLIEDRPKNNKSKFNGEKKEKQLMIF